MLLAKVVWSFQRRVRSTYLELAVRRTRLLQLRVHRDLRVQHLRYWAALFGGFGELLKGRGIRAWNLADNIDVAGSDGPAGIQLFHGERNVRGDTLRRQWRIRSAQLRR